MIYGALVCSYLLGVVFFSSSIARHISNSRLLLLSVILAFVSLIFVFNDFPHLSTGWPSTRFDRIFLGFLGFDFAVGVYHVSMDALQAAVLPSLQRQILLAVIRIPMSTFSSLTIFFFSGQEHKLMLTAIRYVEEVVLNHPYFSLLGVGSTLSIVLDIALSHHHKRTETNRDLVVLAPAAPSI